MTALPSKWGGPLRMGWSVIPLRPRDKVPALQSWKAYQGRLASAGEVARWVVNGCNIGIVTGTISGLLVLDLDSADAMVEAERHGLPDTVIARTAKGRHHYFRHPGSKVKNRAAILPGMDVRGDGGFVVGPGSIHPTSIRYEWITGPDEVPLAPPPAWLVDLMGTPAPAMPAERPFKAHRTRSLPQAEDCSRYGLAALSRESEAVRRAYNGQQEPTLNSAGLRIGALVAGGELTVATARLELIRAGMCMANHDAGNPWTLTTITAKVDRALADGAGQPRSAPLREVGGSTDGFR